MHRMHCMARSAAKKNHLRLVPEAEPGVRGLLSGRVIRGKETGRPSRKKRKVTEPLPEDLRELGDVYVAGRKVQKELEFKTRFAEQRVKEYCMRRFAELYADSGKRPPSMDFQGAQSHFTFIQTSRINLTPDKAEALRSMDLPVDRHTELKGLRINYEAIRQHKLEEPLRKALEDMGVPNDVLEQVFVPEVQLKESFFEILDNFAASNLKPGENLSDRIYEIMQILQPANQVRNADLPGLNAKECFDLVDSAEIVLPESDEEFDVA